MPALTRPFGSTPRMLRAKLPLIIVSTSIAIGLSVAPAWPQTWARTFGDPVTGDDIQALALLPSGIIVAAGRGVGPGSVAQDLWLVAFDPSGRIVWEEVLPQPGAGDGHAIQATADGGLIVAGSLNLSVADRDAWLLKLDGSGAVQWQMRYGGPSWDSARAVRQTPDLGYLVAGSTRSYGASLSDAWIFKVDAAGTLEWQRVFGTGGYDAASTIAILPGGEALVGGRMATGSWDATWLVRLDALGAVRWEKTYDLPGIDGAAAIEPAAGGGFAVASFAFDLGHQLFKIDAVGDMEWQYSYGAGLGTNPTAMRTTPDGGYALAGFGLVGANQDQQFSLIKVDAFGAIEWQRAYGGADTDRGFALELLPGGEYLIAGYSLSFGGFFDAWSLRVGSEGQLPGCDHDPGWTVAATNAMVTDVSFSSGVAAAVANPTTAPVVATSVRTAQQCGTILLAVRFSEVAAERVAGGVRIRWETSSEIDTVGFTVWRSAEASGSRAVQVADFVGAHGPSSPYEALDPTAPSAAAFYYVLEHTASGEGDRSATARAESRVGGGARSRLR